MKSLKNFLIKGRNAFAACALVCSLAACSTSSLISTATGLPPEVIKEAQGYAAKVCNFVPSEATVRAIFAALGGNVSAGDYVALASKVCEAVKKVSVRKGGKIRMSVRVNGKVVKVEGKRG